MKTMRIQAAAKPTPSANESSAQIAPPSWTGTPGNAAAWMRIVFTGGRLLRRPGMRRFVTAGLGVGIIAVVLELALLPATESQQDAGWLLLASLAVISFLLAGMLGQPRTDRLHRI